MSPMTSLCHNYEFMTECDIYEIYQKAIDDSRWLRLIGISIKICLFDLILLRPINSLSVIKGRVFLGRTSTKLGLMFLLKDTTQ